MVKAIVLSLIGSLCMAYFIVMVRMGKSNNYGDVSGNVSDFSRGTWYVSVRNDYKTKRKAWQNDISFWERQSRF